jgi:hypothetical protein
MSQLKVNLKRTDEMTQNEANHKILNVLSQNNTNNFEYMPSDCLF